MKSLNEMPMIIPGLDKEFMDSELDSIIKKAFDNKSWYQEGDNLYKTPISMTESVWLYGTSDNVIGALRTKYKNYNNKVYVEIWLSKKYNDSHKGLLATLLPKISKLEKKPIMSGDEFTADSVVAWLKFVKNPQKYGIIEVQIADIVTKKNVPFIKNQIFGKDEKFKNKRILLNF